MECNLCGSNKLRLRYKGNIDLNNLDRFSQYSWYGDLYECLSCGFVIQKLEHSIDQILKLLENEKYLDEEIGTLNIEEKGVQFRKLISIMKKTSKLKDSKLLDVGSNTGVFLKEFRKYSDNIFGVEPSKEAAIIAQTLFPQNVQNAVISSAILENTSFDIITMWDVIEHLYDPSSDLMTLFQKLKPGGIVYITTHDVGDWFAKIMGPNYPAYMYQHFFHFSQKTLCLMLQKQGFQIVNLQRFCKSWSLGYLYQMLQKIWPKSYLISIIRAIMWPILMIPGAPQVQLSIPIWNFFIIAAERPSI